MSTTDLDSRTVAEMIAEARDRSGLSRAELAARTGLGEPAVWAIETGADPRPSFHVLEPLAYALEISLGRLLLAAGVFGDPRLGRPSEVARLVVRPGEGERFLTLLETFIRTQVDGEPGTEAFSWHQPPDEPDVFWLYERFADDAGMVAHMDSLAHRELKVALGDLVTEASLHFVRHRLGKA